MNFLWLISGILFDVYFVLMNILSPGTFLGTFFSFSAVWFWLSAFCLAMFFLRKRHLWRNLSKTAKTVVLSVLGLGFAVAATALFFICNPKLGDGTEQVDYVILLGGGITKDAELTNSVKQRVMVCGEYLKSHPDAVCVVTGGKGPFSPCSESNVLKPAVVACGVEDSRVLEEDKAKDTIQNFEFSSKVLSEYTGKSIEEILNSRITVITNDFHIARAERLAKRIGYTQVTGFCAKTPVAFKLNTYCREICCYIKLNLRIFLTGKPKRLY